MIRKKILFILFIYFHFCEILHPKKNLVINQPTSQN